MVLSGRHSTLTKLRACVPQEKEMSISQQMQEGETSLTFGICVEGTALAVRGENREGTETTRDFGQEQNVTSGDNAGLALPVPQPQAGQMESSHGGGTGWKETKDEEDLEHKRSTTYDRNKSDNT